MKSPPAALPPEALGENPFLPLPASGGSWRSLAPGILSPIPAPYFTVPSLCVCVSRTLPLHLGPILSHYDLVKIETSLPGVGRPGGEALRPQPLVSLKPHSKTGGPTPSAT